MKRTEIEIRKLIADFFDGKTTIAEEKELYQYFAEEDIAEGLQQYKSLFQYFETEVITELDLLDKEEDKLSLQQVEKKTRRGKLYIALSAIAACLLLVVLINPFDGKSNLYEGSYSIVNGEKVYLSDIDEIEKIEQSILASVEEQERDVKDLFHQIDEQEQTARMLEEKAMMKENKYEQIVNNINKKIEENEQSK